MRPTRIGLIGCGRIAQRVHLQVLSTLRDVDLVALAEHDPQRRAAASQRVPAAKAVVDYRELLALPEVEAVVICLPTAMHAEVAIAAFEQGKHVYLEKPLATSTRAAAQVLAAWQQTALVGMIGFNYRYNALYQAARQRIERGDIGPVVSARTVFASAARPLPAWKQARQSGGGVLLDLASHHVDLIHFVFGQPIASVRAEVQSQHSEADTAWLQLRLANGIAVQSLFAMHAVDEDRFEVYGQQGKISVDRQHGWNATLTPPTPHGGRAAHLRATLGDLVRSPYARDRLLAPTSEPSFRAALTHFATLVRYPHATYPSLRDGYRSLAVVEAAEESATIGHTVRLEETRNAHFAGQ